MKFPNSNLLMNVAGIDLTETEMEAIAGGQIYSATQLTYFWNQWQKGDQKSALAAANTVTDNEKETQIEIVKDWYKTLQDRASVDAAFKKYLESNTQQVKSFAIKFGVDITKLS